MLSILFYVFCCGVIVGSISCASGGTAGKALYCNTDIPMINLIPAHKILLLKLTILDLCMLNIFTHDDKSHRAQDRSESKLLPNLMLLSVRSVNYQNMKKPSDFLKVSLSSHFVYNPCFPESSGTNKLLSVRLIDAHHCTRHLHSCWVTGEEQGAHWNPCNSFKRVI